VQTAYLIAEIVVIPLSGWLTRVFSTRWLFAASAAGLSMWAFSYITSDWSREELLVPQVLRGFPQVFAVAPAVGLGLGSLPPQRLKYASGLFNVMRNLGGAVGITVCGAILNAQTNFHFNMIASHLTPANGPMARLLTGAAQCYGAIPGSPEAGHIAAMKTLWHLAYREAATLAYAHAFRAILVAFVIATLLVPLLRNVAASPASASASH
jgi:DHA2 family multidrug resistance protein